MIRTDCLHFRGDKPCVHKRVCGRCPEYKPIRRKLLLIKRGAMGDVLRTTALLPALRRKFPGHALYWLVDAESVDLLAENPGIDRILPFDLDHALGLQAMRFEALVCLDKEPGAAGLATTLAARRRFGFGLDALATCRPQSASAYALRLGVDDDLKFAQPEAYQEIVAGMAGLDIAAAITNLSLRDRSPSARATSPA
jgi:heptosyltransferase-2